MPVSVFGDLPASYGQPLPEYRTENSPGVTACQEDLGWSSSSTPSADMQRMDAILAMIEFLIFILFCFLFYNGEVAAVPVQFRFSRKSVFFLLVPAGVIVDFYVETEIIAGSQGKG